MRFFSATFLPIATATRELRIAPAKRLSRLRGAWFVLGVACGMWAPYALHYSTTTLHTVSAAFSSYIASTPSEELDSTVAEIAVAEIPVTYAAAIEPIAAPAAPSVAENSAEIASSASSSPVSEPQPVVPPKLVEKPTIIYPLQMNVPIKRGDTLLSVLTDRGIASEEANKIVQTMKQVYNPSQLSVGQSLEMQLDKSKRDENKLSLSNLSIEVSPAKTISLVRGKKDNFVTKEINAPLTKGYARAGGVIRNSLYSTATQAGMSGKMVNEIITALSYDVDFQRDIQEGDELDVVFERMHTQKNYTTSYGNILYISLKLHDRDITLYRHATKDGFAGYYNKKGESVKRALLKTPMNGAQITSGFGMRTHPILGYSKMHKGIDFAAATGTPIYAAGEGVVEEIGVKGGYGNYVRLKHSNSHSTAYAHTSRFAKGLKVGSRVKQGQVIAYVGSTGQSTGPHLHYEILVNNQQVNPSGVKFKTGQSLAGKELAEFKKQMKVVDVALNNTPRKTQLAMVK